MSFQELDKHPYGFTRSAYDIGEAREVVEQSQHCWIIGKAIRGKRYCRGGDAPCLAATLRKTKAGALAALIAFSNGEGISFSPDFMVAVKTRNFHKASIGFEDRMLVPGFLHILFKVGKWARAS